MSEIKSWRPEGWILNQPIGQVLEDGKEGTIFTARLLNPNEIALFEAGADAMLEALRKKAYSRQKVTDGKLISISHPNEESESKSGVYVFIPDEEEEKK